LLDLLVDPIAIYTFYNCLPNLWIKSTNKGLYKKADGLNVPVDTAEMQMIRKTYKERAEFYMNYVLEYIKDADNRDKYPEFFDDCDKNCGQDEGFNFGLDYIGTNDDFDSFKKKTAII